MPKDFVRRLQKQHGSVIVAVPRALVEAMRCEVGDYVWMSVMEDGFSVRLFKARKGHWNGKAVGKDSGGEGSDGAVCG